MEKFNVETISNGIAYGRAINASKDFIINEDKCVDLESEKNLYKDIIEEVIADLELLNKNEIYKGEEFLGVHIMILKDPELTRQVIKEIEDNNYHCDKAFDIVISRYIESFSNASSTYLIERNLDFKDIRDRVLKKLKNKMESDYKTRKIILVCNELYPSLLMEYKDRIVGVISKTGGATSHGAILCKAREIPYVLYPNDIEDGTKIIIDTRESVIILNSTDEVFNEYKALKSKIKEASPISDFRNKHIRIYANVSSNNDVENIMKYNPYGVGLFRTEFIFMNLNRALTVDEQYDIYLEALEKLKGKEICFRTFDIGDDKQLSYVRTFRKGIENYKNNRHLFEDQVRALIRANKFSNMKIMFPMIESYEEYAYLRDWVLKIRKEEGSYNTVKIGMMMETKSALEHLDSFIDIDFMSIGTNDLSTELYNINRNDVLNYSSFIDDLCNKIELVVNHCKKYNIELSICGELAGIKEVVMMLYKVGVRRFSVSSSNIKILEMTLHECALKEED